MLEGEIFGFYRPLLKKLGKWGKPLGGCVICMNAWLSIISFFFTGLSVLWLIAYLGLSFVSLQIISSFEE